MSHSARATLPTKYKDVLRDLKKGKVKLTRSGFYQSIFRVRGEALSFDHAQFWIPIINNIRLTPLVDKSERIIVCRTSRQVYKTTFLAEMSLGFSIEHDYFNTLILEPTDSQITELSTAKIQDIEGSSIITDYVYFDPKKNERQVKRRQFSTNSRIILANIYATVRSARGISADATFFDEVQGLPKRNVEIVESSAQRSEYKYRIYTGTSLEEDNLIEDLFQMSTQNIWVTKCDHCGFWNGPMTLRNVGLRGLICERCHGRINIDPRVNKSVHWHPLNPGANIDGYHINELMLPRNAPGAMSWLELLRYLETKDEQTIRNELLGLPHKGAKTPLDLKTMRQHCGTHPLVSSKFDVTPDMTPYTFAGLDWAMRQERRTAGQRDITLIKSFTSLTICQYNPNSKKAKTLFVKRYYDSDTEENNDPEFVLKDIAKWLIVFKVLICGADYGVGHKENQRLMNMVGNTKIIEFLFVGRLDERYIWDKVAKNFHVDRTQIFDDTINAIKNEGMFIFPQFDGYFSEYVTDFTTNYTVEDINKRTKKYDQRRANDVFINIIYIRLVILYYMQELDYKGKKY